MGGRSLGSSPRASARVARRARDAQKGKMPAISVSAESPVQAGFACVCLLRAFCRELTGARVLPQQGQYETMCRAARDGDLGTVESLLGAGVPPDLPVSQQQTAENDKKHGMTPLLWASERGHVPVVKALLKADARLDATDPFCMTSLHWASARGHKDIVCLLVAAGQASWARLRPDCKYLYHCSG